MGPVINSNAKNIKNNNIINILYAKNNIGCGQKQGLRLLSSQPFILLITASWK